MTLVNAERIKLASTRSPYWCLVAILVQEARESRAGAVIAETVTAQGNCE